jgi:hypothetical protein
VAIVLALISLGGYEWLQEHDVRAKAEAQTAAQQKNIDQAKADTKTVRKTLATQLQTLETQRQQPATAQRIVKDAAKQFPDLPAPLQVVTPPPTEQTVNGKTVEVPSAPVVQIPQVDFAALQNGMITCQENAAKLTACTLTAADTEAELKATTAQRDVWEKTAKGGSFWQRAGNATKHIGCGLSGGAAGVETSNKSTPLNGGIAAVGVTGGCELVVWLIGRAHK